MKKSLCRGLIAFTSLAALASCQDYDGGFSLDQIKKASYAKDFEKTFGTPDPNQDWSMAQCVKATVNVPDAEGYTVTFYTHSPLFSDVKILGSSVISNGVACITLDAVKGSDQVFVEVTDGKNNFPVMGYYPINNGVVTVSKNSSLTRAAGDSPVSIGDPLSYKIYMRPGSADYATSTFTDNAKWENKSWSGNSDVQYVQNMYLLKNYDQAISPSEEMYLGELATFLRSYVNSDGETKPGVFAEGTNHVTLMNDGVLEPNAGYTMAEAGPITLKYVYKGTVERHNYFGYFYYPSDMEVTADNFQSLKKYIMCPYITGGDGGNENEDGTLLMWKKFDQNKTWDLISYDDGPFYYDWDTGHTQPYYTNPVYDNVPHAWGEYSKIGGMQMTTTDGVGSAANDRTIMLKGSTMKLTFFGYDGTETPTYTFPKGCKVGFFIAKYFSEDDSSNNKLYTSYAQLNRDFINEVPTGATFRYRNYVVFGMEDQPYGDKDQNDILFLAQGNFKMDEIPDITPDDDPEKDPETQKWLVACEDLGGTFDYDFNDIVIGFEKKADGHLWMTPLTSGGTLPSVVYYEGKGEVGEIHQLLGEAAADIYSANVTCRPGTAIDLGACDDESIGTALKKLSIKVDGGNGNVTILTTAFAEDADETPQMLLLPGGWDWPTETTGITTVYNGFVQWVKDADYTSWTKKSGASYINNTWGK